MGLFTQLAFHAAESIGKNIAKHTVHFVAASVIGAFSKDPKREVEKEIRKEEKKQEKIDKIASKFPALVDYWNDKKQIQYLNKFEKEADEKFQDFLLHKTSSSYQNCIFVANSPKATFFLNSEKLSPFSLIENGDSYFFYDAFNDALIGQIKINECTIGRRTGLSDNIQGVQEIEFFVGPQKIGNIQIIKRTHINTVGVVNISVDRVRCKMNPEEKEWHFQNLFEEKSLDFKTDKKSKIGSYSFVQFNNMERRMVLNLMMVYCGILKVREIYPNLDVKKEWIKKNL